VSSPTRTLIVSHHAVHRYKDRRRDGRSWEVIEREIADTVRLALAEGRVARQKMNGFRLYREKPRQLPPGERFVWDEEATVAWIVRRHNSGQDVVQTTLMRTSP
jgi:hypothetical protein